MGKLLDPDPLPLYDFATAYDPSWRDAIVGLLKKGASNLTGGALFPTIEQRKTLQDSKSVIPEISDPANKELLSQTMLGFGPGHAKGAVIGSLRSGGNPKLQIAHVLEDPTALLKYEPRGASRVQPYKELSSPSFSIRPYGMNLPFWNPESPIVIPKINALEPFNHPGDIVNRDAYVKRGGVMSTALRDPKTRLEQRFDPKSLRLEESAAMGQGGSTGEFAHDLSILSSPHFRSFKAYEESPAGAGVLPQETGGRGEYPFAFRNNIDPFEWGSVHEGKIRQWLNDKGFQWGRGSWEEKLTDFPRAMEMMRKEAAAGDKQAREMLYSAKHAPSEYGEVKTKGPLSLTSEKIAGIALPDYTHYERFNEGMTRVVDALAHQYKRKGIPVERYPGESMSPDDLSKMIDDIQHAAPHYGR